MKPILFAFALLFLAACAAAHPEEAKGIVTKIIDGASFEVGGVGCVRLADVEAPPSNSMRGLEAREFTRDQLMNTQVFLDLDDNGTKGPDGCLLAVVYKADMNGTANRQANYNAIFIRAGHGSARDNPDTEFDPSAWNSST